MLRLLLLLFYHHFFVLYISSASSQRNMLLPHSLTHIPRHIVAFKDLFLANICKKESKRKRLEKMMCKQNNFILLQDYCYYFFKGLSKNILTIKILNKKN